MSSAKDKQVVVDPVAAAAQLGQSGKNLPGVPENPGGVPSERSRGCALGHDNPADVRFCGTCGLPMDAPAPSHPVEVTRPRPAAELSAEERAERERQHAEALAAARQFEAQQPVYEKAEGEVVVIHFVDDGFTFAGQVWYRGQELEIGPGHPRWPQVIGWITLTKFEQIERYGKQFFDHGPWPGRRSYLDGAGDFQPLYVGRDDKGKLAGKFAGPGEEALRAADAAERRRGRAVPGLPRL